MLPATWHRLPTAREFYTSLTRAVKASGLLPDCRFCSLSQGEDAGILKTINRPEEKLWKSARP